MSIEERLESIIDISCLCHYRTRWFGLEERYVEFSYQMQSVAYQWSECKLAGRLQDVNSWGVGSD